MQAVTSSLSLARAASASARVAPRAGAAAPRIRARAERRDRAVPLAPRGPSAPSGLGLGLGLAAPRSRGASVAARAKKKRPAVEAPPPPEDEDEDEDADADGYDDDDDAWGDDADADDADDADALDGSETDAEGFSYDDAEDDALEDGARDASELLPSARYGDEEEEGESALGAAVGAARESLSNPAVRNLGILGLSVLAGSFLLSAYNVYMKYNSNRSKRKRQVNKNVVVVERLRDFFPDNRDSLTRGHIRGLQGKTGFKPPEIFRKYARYKLNEEPFTNAFVADVLALRRACELDGETVAAVLEETGERIVKKYGTLMRDVADMGPAGAQRKADGCAMFAKVMYLADLEEFVPAELGRATQLRLKEIFGATDEDYEKLRIDALGSDDADISVLEAMITEKTAEPSGEERGGEEGEQQP
jgi:hypothetical protein